MQLDDALCKSNLVCHVCLDQRHGTLAACSAQQKAPQVRCLQARCLEQLVVVIVREVLSPYLPRCRQFGPALLLDQLEHAIYSPIQCFRHGLHTGRLAPSPSVRAGAARARTWLFDHVPCPLQLCILQVCSTARPAPAARAVRPVVCQAQNGNDGLGSIVSGPISVNQSSIPAVDPVTAASDKASKPVDRSKGLWTRCDKCGTILYIKHLKEHNHICFGCNYHLKVSTHASQRPCSYNTPSASAACMRPDGGWRSTVRPLLHACMHARAEDGTPPPRTRPAAVRAVHQFEAVAPSPHLTSPHVAPAPALACRGTHARRCHPRSAST